MTDDRRKPPRPGTMSDEDRALAGMRHRSSPRGVPVVDPTAPETPWHEEKTGVHTDSQVFRALKALRAEFVKAFKAIVQRVDDVEAKGDETRSIADKTEGRVDVLVAQPRTRSESNGSKLLATHLLIEKQEERKDKREERGDQRQTRQFRHALALRVIGISGIGVTAWEGIKWLIGRLG